MNWSDFYEFGAIVTYHDQPPIDTPAAIWKAARSITPETTVAELLDWADRGGMAHVIKLQITVSAKKK